MLTQQTTSAISAGTAASLRLPYHWLRAIQMGVLLIAFGYGVLTVMGTPVLFARYQHVVPTSARSDLGQLSPTSVAALERFGLSLKSYAAIAVSFTWFGTLISWSLGVVLLVKKAKEPVALIFAVACLILPSSPAVMHMSQVYPAMSVPRQFLSFISDSALILLWSLFPDGRWVPRWSRWIAFGAVAYYAIYAFAIVPLSVSDLLATFTYNVLLPCVLIYLISTQVYRYRWVSATEQRQQIKWVLFAFFLQALVILSVVVASWFQSLLYPLIYLISVAFNSATILAVGLAIFRYRLFDIDRLLNRLLVYTVLTGAVATIYVVIVGSFSALLQLRGNLFIALLTTGVVAVLFQPLRDRVQHMVNRMLYGDRDDPYTVLVRLGQRLEATLAQEAVLATIVETVAHALKLPYAAITVATNDDRSANNDQAETIAAEYGRFPAALPYHHTFSLTYQGVQVGHLLLAPRGPDELLTPTDHRVLTDVARHAGIAVHAVRLTCDLQRARERLVTTREEERRRLRRDLHDGLGPVLASQALMLDTVGLLLDRNPVAAAPLVHDLKAQAQTMIADIRRIVYELRPPALDDLGLIGALREQAGRYAASIEIVLSAPEHLPPLPAAVEVAIYRIIQEALTNVVRHAQAQRCIVEVLFDTAVEIRISDNGVGLPSTYAAGVGLTSMRERSEELGGRWIIEPDPSGGTRVVAQIPL